VAAVIPDQSDAHRANNFDTMRLAAALTVLFAHSIPLTYGPGTLDILWPLSHHQTTFGQLAVQVFFVISGYLITASYLHLPAPRRFLRARLLRLVPALLVLFVVLAGVLGPLVTALPLAAYARALPGMKFGISDHLPGVFASNPFSAGVDGSLWTLRYEAECYLAILLLGLARLLNRITLAAVFLIVLAGRLHFGPLPALDLGALFFAGAAIRVWQPPFEAMFAVPAAFLWVISLLFHGYTLISDTAGAYVILCLALSPGLKLPNLAKYGDLSYGVYIFAWPIQQTIVLVSGGAGGWIVNSLIAAPLDLGLAYLSWHFVESPALHLKNTRLFGIL
jgi:peptidoglycan/LPS O-acetylase OafA/YrhL